jgi:hypothetical protein
LDVSRIAADGELIAWDTAMTTAKEYRKYADECLRWAAEAETQEDREGLLQLARDWTLAALRLEGALIPEAVKPEPRRQPSQ